MKKRKNISILVHILIWFFLSLGYFFLAEPVAAYMFPEIYDVEIWLIVLVTGLILIFMGTIISLIVSFRTRRRKL